MIDNVIHFNITTPEDQHLFDTMALLIKKQSSLFNNISYDDASDTIRYVVPEGNVEYEYSKGSGKIVRGEDALIDTSGASWFKEMRGEQAPPAVKAQNNWKKLITSVAQLYYKDNPCLVYADTDSDYNTKVAEQKEFVSALVQLFFGEGAHELSEQEERRCKKIYAASLVMYISVSAGAPTPIVGKLYFSVDEDKEWTFLNKEDASKLENRLATVNLSGNSQQGTRIEEEKEENGIDVKKLEELLQKGDNLADKIVFNRENQAVLDHLTEKLVKEKKKSDVEVEITKVETNIFFAIIVREAAFDICFTRSMQANVPVMQATLLFDRISLVCKSCRQEGNADGVANAPKRNMINNNIISYKDENGVEKEVEVLYEDKKVAFLTKRGKISDVEEQKQEYDDLVAELKKYVFSKHLYRVNCNGCAGHRECYGYVCKINQQDVLVGFDGEEEVTEIRCVDCQYPESYSVIDNKAYDLSLLSYDVDKKRFVFGKGKNCEVCGRAIAKDKKNNRCNLCQLLTAQEPEIVQRQTKLYHAYCGLLPLAKRIFRARKRCVEDSAVIVFSVNNKTYVYDKVDGYIDGFKAMRRK